jgi:hypothetical protein
MPVFDQFINRMPCVKLFRPRLSSLPRSGPIRYALQACFHDLERDLGRPS